jgi:uncharacterized protein YbjQ (UPF0145 family)
MTAGSAWPGFKPRTKLVGAAPDQERSRCQPNDRETTTSPCDVPLRPPVPTGQSPHGSRLPTEGALVNKERILLIVLLLAVLQAAPLSLDFPRRRLEQPLLRDQRRQVDQLRHLGDRRAVGDQVGAAADAEHLPRRPVEVALYEDALDPVAGRATHRLSTKGSRGRRFSSAKIQQRSHASASARQNAGMSTNCNCGPSKRSKLGTAVGPSGVKRCRACGRPVEVDPGDAVPPDRMSTLAEIPGHRVVRTLGVVSELSSASGFTAGLKGNMALGSAMIRLRRSAAALGGNAIVGLNANVFGAAGGITSVLGGDAVGVLLIGTAVLIEVNPNDASAARPEANAEDRAGE